MHQSKALGPILAGFLGGVALVSFVVVPTVFSWTLLAVGLACLSLRRPVSLLVGLSILALCLGAWRTSTALRAVSVLTDTASRRVSVTVDGFVDGDFQVTANGGRWPFRVTALHEGGRHSEVDERIMVYGQDWVRPRYGQALTLSGVLRLPENSSDFDYVSYLAKDGVHTQMYYPEFTVPNDVDAPLEITLKRPLYRLRDAIGDSLARAVPQPEAAYLGGILLGTRGTIDRALADAFSRTGTSHVLAISGYNITIIAGIMASLLSRFGRTRAFWLTGLGIVLFTVMVGASASVVRAAVMGIIGLTAIQVGRQSSPGTAMLSAASGMCTYNPMLLRWDVGFQLSFLAVAGIVYLEPLIRPTVERVFRWKAPSQVLATTLAAQLMVLPLILLDFGTLAVYSVPVNLLVLPLVPAAMLLAFIAGTTGLVVPFVASLIGQLAWLVAAVQIATIRWFSNLPSASLDVQVDSPLVIACYLGIAAWLVSVYRGGSEPRTTQANTPHAAA